MIDTFSLTYPAILVIQYSIAYSIGWVQISTEGNQSSVRRWGLPLRVQLLLLYIMEITRSGPRGRFCTAAEGPKKAGPSAATLSGTQNPHDPQRNYAPYPGSLLMLFSCDIAVCYAVTKNRQNSINSCYYHLTAFYYTIMQYRHSILTGIIITPPDSHVEEEVFRFTIHPCLRWNLPICNVSNPVHKTSSPQHT